MRCLVAVPHLGAARTYSIEGNTLNALKEAIRACPVLGGKVDLSSSSFQILDKAFEEYVDLSDEDTIADMSKIQLHSHVSKEQIASTSSQDTTSENVTPSGEQEQEIGMGGYFDLPSHSDDDGHTFVLPSLGALHGDIVSGKQLSSAAFKKIVNTLFTEMMKITLFPTRNFYAKVTSLLIEKYPQLKDVVGSGADSWKVALRYRFKHQRRALPRVGRVAENRSKFAARRKSSKAMTGELQRHKMPKMAVAMCEMPGEDEESLAMHIEWLMCEHMKSAPDEEEMKERLKLTSKDRISDFATSNVRDIKMKYPYVMNFERFCSDFQILTKIDLSASIASGIESIAKLVEQKVITCEASAMTLLEQARDMDPQRLRTRHILTIAVLRVLSGNVKEQDALSTLFLHEEDSSVPATPCVLYSGENVEDANLLHMRVDRDRLFSVKNAEEGLAAVMSAYWLFNIQYNRKLFNTFVVLERLFFGLSLSAPRPVATKFLNKVYRNMHVYRG